MNRSTHSPHTWTNSILSFTSTDSDNDTHSIDFLDLTISISPEYTLEWKLFIKSSHCHSGVHLLTVTVVFTCSLSQWCSLVLSLVYAFWGFVPKARCCQEPVHESQPELMKWKRTTGRNGTDITTIESQQLPRKQKYKRTIKAASKPMNDWNEATMEKNDYIILKLSSTTHCLPGLPNVPADIVQIWWACCVQVGSIVEAEIGSFGAMCTSVSSGCAGSKKEAWSRKANDVQGMWFRHEEWRVLTKNVVYCNLHDHLSCT